MIFVDASAMIAFMADEAEADAFSDILEREAVRLCSAVSVWETLAGLSRVFGIPAASGLGRVARFLGVGGFRYVDIGANECRIALEAFQRFGKGHHPARLNMGDCFAYACTQVSQAKLLYKGQDFARTDVKAVFAAH